MKDGKITKEQTEILNTMTFMIVHANSELMLQGETAVSDVSMRLQFASWRELFETLMISTASNLTPSAIAHTFINNKHLMVSFRRGSWACIIPKRKKVSAQLLAKQGDQDDEMLIEQMTEHDFWQRMIDVVVDYE